MSNEQKVTSKLRAILSADVKGYSLLMADDEVFTIRTLKGYRQIMSDLIQQHSGRIVDNPGDNLLAEFGSAVDAVAAGVQIQNRLKKENAEHIVDNEIPYIDGSAEEFCRMTQGFWHKLLGECRLTRALANVTWDKA